MRMLKKGGTPCDRRIDRRKVAMAAAAALFLFATAAQAQNYVQFQIDATNSFLGIRNSGFIGTDGAGNFNTPFLATTAIVPGLVNGGAIPNGSLDASIRGYLFATTTPGSVQFTSTGAQTIDQKVTGNYKPGRDDLGNVTTTASAQPGNEGGKNTAVAALINGHGNQYDSPGSYLDPVNAVGPTALAVDGLGNFDATGISLPQIDGWQDITSGIASPAKIHNDGNLYPVNLSVTYASGAPGTPVTNFVSDIGNIDPVTFHLVLPINFTFWSPVTSGANLIGYLISTVEGKIIADPVQTPEPSAMVLAGFGVVGLLSYAWRARRRKALVA